jgi:TolB protein
MKISKKLKLAASVASICVCVSSAIALVALAHGQEKKKEMVSTIAFVSTRHQPSADPSFDMTRSTEIYIMDEDASNVTRLTNNSYGDWFPSISPDGKTIVFDSNRLRTESEPYNTSDLFLMNIDGSGQKQLIRGSSATWSRDSKSLAYHASVSGTGKPIAIFPGAAANDSDIFVMSVVRKGAKPKNITNNPTAVDDDPDWSPTEDKIVFISKDAKDDMRNPVSAEIYIINANGTGKPIRLTNNSEEERAPTWSPDGKRILFMCRRGGTDFELCIMNADGSAQIQLTDNTVGDLGGSWSPDGRKVVVHRPIARGRYQLWLINVDGSGEVQLTDAPGTNGFPNWGEVRRRGPTK